MNQNKVLFSTPRTLRINIKIYDQKRKGYRFLHMKNISYVQSLYIAIIIIIIIIPLAIANWDPYEVIGVKRDASLDQIKKAYRELARKLHPDKNNLSDDDAGRRFIELSKAFSILKDPDKRSRYDQHGQTEEYRHSKGYPHQSRQTREYWSYGQGSRRTFTFTYSGQRADSYLNFCPTCNMIEGTWNKIADELAKYNIDSFSINVHHEQRLSQELGVNSIPHIACLIDGEIKSYYQPEISLANIVKFTKNLLPNNLVNTLITDEEQDRFIALGPQQNKLSAIILHNENNLKLRYLLLAYEFRSYYRFGHISKKLSQYETFSHKYNLSTDSKSTETNILIFNENINKPVVKLDVKPGIAFDMTQVRNQLYKWPFLKLPKLSSQQKFDDLCLYTIPKDGSRTTIKLCVIFFSTDKPSSQQGKKKLVDFIEMNNFLQDEKVSFVYIDINKQSEFIASLLLETEHTYPFKSNKEDETIESALIILERHQQNSRKALHKWINSRWNVKNLDELDKAKLELYDTIIGYKTNKLILKDKVAIDLLIDEEGPSLADRVFWRFVNHILKTIYYITSKESFSTVLILIACAVITSFLLYQSPSSTAGLSYSSNNDNISDGNNNVNSNNNNSKTETNHNDFVRQRQNSAKNFQTSKFVCDDLRLIELKAETYNGMIRLLKPGYRSIIVLVDGETKDKLLVEFKKAVWPYRRNKTLLFGYLCLDKNLQWYKYLLQEVLGVEDVNLNKKNCIGTVLSLNGFKKYFRVYHAKHHEIDYYDNDTNNDGSFLGFDDRDEEGDYNDDIEKGKYNKICETIYTVDNLLDRLPIWLDKMFDGLTKRYFLDNWPDEMN